MKETKTQATLTPPILLTLDEAAKLLRMMPIRLARLARRNVVPSVVLPDKELRFLRQDLLEWVDDHRRPKPDHPDCLLPADDPAA